MPTPTGDFPIKSLAVFVVVAIILRGLVILAGMFFPGPNLLPYLVRLIISFLVVVGLWTLNQRLLGRDGFPSDALGLNLRRGGWFFAGGFIMAIILLSIMGVLWLLAPFHWEKGTLTGVGLLWQTLDYLGGNLGEELVFRGYLLLLLTRYLGLTSALFIVALLFGLFHLPGLSGWIAVKMICTTAVMSFLFAYGFISSGSLWTAFGLHVFGNVLLHCVLGMSSSASLYNVVADAAWPRTYDPGFWALMSVTIAIVVVAAFFANKLNPRL